MANLPNSVRINEEGPREGFQYEKGAIPTARKVELIDALSTTGLKHIQIVSFVNPKVVPGMADAEEVVKGITLRPGVDFTGLWLNEQGLHRALATGRLHVRGSLSLNASAKFLKRNQNKTPEQQLATQRAMIDIYKNNGIDVERGGIMAAFGCNFEGEVPVLRVIGLVQQLLDLAADEGVHLKWVSLADTMAWATPLSIKRTVGAVQDRFPDLPLSLHLHDTRGMGLANAYAGLEMGISLFDSSVAGLGGCPFAGHAGAAGNVCTEDLVFMCDEMGIETGIDLEALMHCARLAEDIVGHPLPGSIKTGGSLRSLRQKLAAAA
jgi:hydroxymethylglutaryl-CoA lyase